MYLRIALLMLSLHAFTSAHSENNDSIWNDSITGIRMHLQRPDTLYRYTCPLHMYGKNSDGTPKHPALEALTEDLGINAMVLSWDYFVTNRSYARISRSVLKQNLTGGWVWDNDSFSGNQFSHPYHGAMFYNAAREHGLSYGVSTIYPLVGSATWEIFCETNRPAVNDLISTGVGGAAIGEVFHRTSDIFFDDTKTGANRVIREIVGSFLNPVRGMHRIVSGEMFRVNHQHAGKNEEPEPYSFLIGIGDDYTMDFGDIHPRLERHYRRHLPYLDIRFTYGNHYNDLDHGIASHAFDFFTLHTLINFSSNAPTVGEFDISGRIGSKQFVTPHRWKFDVGFYQNIKYVDHFTSSRNEHPGNLAIISEAASFGAGFHAERHGKAITLIHDFMLSAVPLGGSTADYYPIRRYNFGTGFSVRKEFQFIYNRHISFGNRLYFMRLFTPYGCTPEEITQKTQTAASNGEDIVEGISSWGDIGQQSILQHAISFNVNVTPNLMFNISHGFYLRHGNYRYYPSHTAKSHNLRFGFCYAM